MTQTATVSIVPILAFAAVVAAFPPTLKGKFQHPFLHRATLLHVFDVTPLVAALRCQPP